MRQYGFVISVQHNLNCHYDFSGLSGDGQGNYEFVDGVDLTDQADGFWITGFPNDDDPTNACIAIDDGDLPQVLGNGLCAASFWGICEFPDPTSEPTMSLVFI